MSLTREQRERRADQLAFDVITLLIDCPDLTDAATTARLREWIRVNVYRLKPNPEPRP